MTTDATNPLLDFSGLPRFDAILAEHVTPAIDHLLARSRTVVQQLEAPQDDVTWDSFVTPLENATELLGRAWSIVNHLNSVVDTPELRATYNDNQPKVTEFWTELSQNEALFAKYKALRASASFAGLSPARQRIIDNAIRDFRMGGAELAGLPDDVKAAAHAAAQKDGKQGWQFSLHFPSYYPILQFADNRALRETVYRANATKASDQGEVFSKKDAWDNTQNIVTLLRLRDEEAKLLGYKNFAEVSLVPKMAQSPEHVIGFLEDLARRARPFAQKDLEELKQFAKDELGIADLQAWDMPYASEKLQERRYAFSAQEVKQYFPEHKVIDGLFRQIQNLFDVKIKPDVAPVWHQDVRFYSIERDGVLIGQFYLDLYARAGKSGGAWMDDARGRRADKQTVQTPIAYLTCNFTEPAVVDGKAQPSLFTHDEVITLFHEFGHGLHHMLTAVDELGVSGISGVEWDAVELPSQFMENFCWEWEVLEHMTAHAVTGEPLPRALYDKMLAAKNFQSGLQTLRQVEFSLLDMHLHYDYDASTGKTVQQLIDEVRAKFALIIPPAFNRFQNSFGHIFAGGYAAGYYSYKWAEVLSADAYAAFEEAKALGPAATTETGKRYLQEILSVGGSRPALESFTAFRGREPSIDALLRHSGMAA